MKRFAAAGSDEEDLYVKQIMLLFTRIGPLFQSPLSLRVRRLKRRPWIRELIPLMRRCFRRWSTPCWTCLIGLRCIGLCCWLDFRGRRSTYIQIGQIDDELEVSRKQLYIMWEEKRRGP